MRFGRPRSVAGTPAAPLRIPLGGLSNLSTSDGTSDNPSDPISPAAISYRSIFECAFGFVSCRYEALQKTIMIAMHVQFSVFVVKDQPINPAKQHYDRESKMHPNQSLAYARSA